MEAKTAQLRVKAGPRGGMQITSYGTTGTMFFETPTRAKFLIDTGAFELANTGPGQTKPLGPSETKPAGPQQKKSYPVAPDGPSIDSASSSEPGAAEPPLSLAADQALPLTNAQPLAKRGPGRPRKSG